MDSRTHVELAFHLLALSGGARPLAVASLFPQIDRQPPTLHRLYAHTAFKAAAMADLGLRSLFGGEVSDEEREGFSHRRFLQEAPRMAGHLGSSPAPAGWSPSIADAPHAVMAFVSHLYLDTFNQPTQAFAPLSVHCCGQWALWERIGDFRLELYTTRKIDLLREELFADGAWARAGRLSAEALTLAMLRRTAAASQGKILSSVADAAMKSTGLRFPDTPSLDRADRLLADFEALLCALHVKAVSSAARRPLSLAHAG